MRKIMYLMSVIAFLTSCATIVRGTHQVVSINSDPSGAEAHLSNGVICTTPCTMKLPRKYTINVTFHKSGCNSYTAALVPNLSGEGVILGDPIDYGTGSIYDLQPNPLKVSLVCNLH